MFLKYFAPLYEPIKWIRTKWIKGSTAVGRVKVDVQRVKSYKNLAKGRAKDAKRKAKEAKQKAKNAKTKMKGWRQGQAQPQPGQLGPAPAAAMAGGGSMAQGHGHMMQGGQPMPGGPMQGGGPGYGPQGAPNPAARYSGAQPGGSPPVNGASGQGGQGGHGIVVAGALWWKKHLCANCSQELDKTWDVCPYCTQGAGGAPVAPRTQAIMVDSAGQGSGMQLLGWLVAIKGPQRGELFTLAPVTKIGTDATCVVVLNDQYMSAQHAEIKAEGGNWVLRDLKSTNGTYVNDKRVEQHELVDNDFIRVGQSVLKFKSL